MRTFINCALSAAAASALLSSCRGSQMPISALPQSRSISTSSTTADYNVVFNFNGIDGAYPQTGLTPSNETGLTPSNVHGGEFDSVTSAGGTNDLGTVFKLTSGGTEKVLHDFKQQATGFEPDAPLTLLNGIFYGETFSECHCRKHANGVVYSVTKSGHEETLYRFKGPPDGSFPLSSGLVALNGTLYGTTSEGGIRGSGSYRNGYGTVFSITPSGEEHVIYSFKGNPDGSDPEAGLILVNGKLYGTTTSGGKYNGTVFSITPAGKERVLHAFTLRGGDGQIPNAPLFFMNGKLYSSTLSGGKYDQGAVFSVTLSGKEQVVYSFQGKSKGDGADPYTPVIGVNGKLYGTTDYGGFHNDGIAYGLTTDGVERILHQFGASGDGKNPQGGLVLQNGVLYSTTFYGGTYNQGTVFAFKP